MTDSTPKNRRRLGRGLDALLGGPLPSAGPDEIAATENSPDAVQDSTAPILIEIDPARIHPNPEQPRRHFNDSSLATLTESIRLHGVLHPIVVERLPGGDYQLVAGERRWRAAERSGVSTLPAIVRPATESARQALELALTENLVRTDLSAMEEAVAYARLADTFGLSHEAIALRVGRSRPYVSNIIRLLNLPATVQGAVADGKLSTGHARALLGISDAASQEALAARIVSHGMSVRDVERTIAASLLTKSRDPSAHPAPAKLSPNDVAVRRGLEEALGTPVRIDRKGHGGRLVIDFFSDDDLSNIYMRVSGRPL